jgi:hypothetical protein
MIKSRIWGQRNLKGPVGRAKNGCKYNFCTNYKEIQNVDAE